MRRSCYALTWLFGTLLVSLVTIGAARGQIPPPSPGSKGKGGDEGDCPKPSTAVAFVLTESEADVGQVVERGWSAGPLGWLPYDDEYRCGLPSENPDAGESATIATLVVQQALEDSPLGPVSGGPDYPVADGARSELGTAAATVSETLGDVQVEDRKLSSDCEFEPLGFRVLGYAGEASEPADADVGQGVAVTEDGSRREVRAAAARESARVLRQWGLWFAAAADRAERWADEQQDEGDAAAEREGG